MKISPPCWARATSATMVLVGLLLVVLPVSVSSRCVLGIDFGSLYMKVALVRSGSPLEIVTNLHSKRKTEQMILFDQGQRFYGADANGLLQRKAQFTPQAMSEFLGRDVDHPNVQAFVERYFPITPTYNETRKGPTLKVPKTGEFTPEELVAMVLQHAVEISLAYAKEAGSNIPPPSDIVLTVPCYATHLERKALVDAARLAGLNVLTLIDETTAAAVHYAHDKNFDEEQVVLFYNMGGSSLQVSIVRLSMYEQKQGFGKPKPVPAVQVLAKTWDSTLGGMVWDNVLVEYMADEFNKLWRKKTGDETKDIRALQRAMTKIRLTANKAKEVLSANTEVPVQLDALHDDVSLKFMLTRDKFEELAQPLLERAIKPVLDALVQANMTTANLTGTELLGGGMRVPSIQAKLAEVLAPVDLGLHMNSDESMALGAAFAGANASTAFRVRHVGLTDLTPFAQQITLSDLKETETEEGGSKGGWFGKFRKTEEKKGDKKAVDSDASAEGEEGWNKKATLFKAYSKVHTKKIITFTHDKDVHCALDYVESDLHAPTSVMKLERYEIRGVAEFAKELREEKKLEGKPKVSLQFDLSLSGLTSLVKAEASMEETYTVEEELEVDDDEADNATEAAGGKDKTDELESQEEDKKDEPPKEDKKEGDKEFKNATDVPATDKSMDTKKKKITVEKEKKRLHKRTLKVSAYYEGKIQPHWDELFAASKAKLQEMDEKDKQRIMLEESKNRVESYMFKIKNKLEDDAEELATVSTEEQREECLKLAKNTEIWLEDEGYDADFTTMEDKYVELSTPFEKILLRLQEKTARPEMVKAVETRLTQVEELLEKWKTTMPHVTEEEHEKVKERIAAVRANVTALEELQAVKATHDDPAYLSTDLPPKLTSLESIMNRLSKKPKPKPQKKETNETATNPTSSSNETTSTSGESAANSSSGEPAADATSNGDSKEDSSTSSGGDDDESKQTNDEL